MASFTEKLNQSFVGWTLFLKSRKAFAELQTASLNPEAAQTATLLRILNKQKSTAFGTEFGFGEIKSPEEYRKAVAIHDYENLRHYIERQDESDSTFINHERPAIYTVTSGTTGKPKYIPVLKSTLLAQKTIANIFSYSMYMERPETFGGKIFAVVSPAEEGKMPSGVPLGSASGQLYEGMPKMAQNHYVVPPMINTIEDYDLKYLAMLRLGIQSPDVTLMTTANPSTFARLLTTLNKNWSWLAKDLSEGTFSKMNELTPDQQAVMKSKLIAMPKYSAELNAIFERQGKLTLKDVWPNIKTVATWTGGNSMIFLSQMKDQFPEGVSLRDLGYLSSEFRGTIPLSSKSTAGVPTLLYNYFEFVETEKWEAGDAKFLGLHQIEDGKDYYLFVTTDAGLYRYNMNDIVRVEGFYNKTPMLRFVQKGAGITNITGEKLFESQVIHAVQNTEASLGTRSSFYLMVADENDARYNLYYEPSTLNREMAQKFGDFALQIDGNLNSINVEYLAKRKSGRLKDLVVKVLKPGTFANYRRFCVEVGGQRESQFKIIALQPSKKVKFDFDAHIADLGTVGLKSSDSERLVFV